MSFGTVLKQSGKLGAFSPNGLFMANSLHQKLLVRDISSLEVGHTFHCVDVIERLEWSSDSQYILCGMFQPAVVQVWSLENPHWTCKIDEGVFGLVSVCWSPDGRSILTTATFHLRITVWSLTNQSLYYARYAKEIAQGLVFTQDGKYMALAERRHDKDCISVFTCSTWHLVSHFKVDTIDMAGISWSPNGSTLCCWEFLLMDHKILFYAPNGTILGSYTGQRCLSGAKSMAWSPSSQFLAIGCYDQKVRLLNYLTWQPILEYNLMSSIPPDDVVIYQERTHTVNPVERPFSGTMPITCTSSKYEIAENRHFTIPSVPFDPEKESHKLGVGILLFSQNGKYIAAVNDAMPAVLWIYSMENFSVTDILVQTHPIQCVEWDPVQVRLALCTGTSNVFIWLPEGCSLIQLPVESGFPISSLRWHPTRDVLLLMGKDNLCIYYLEPE